MYVNNLQLCLYFEIVMHFILFNTLYYILGITFEYDVSSYIKYKYSNEVVLFMIIPINKFGLFYRL